LSMISAQTLRVCREGKPVPTFTDHAVSLLRPARRHVSMIGDVALDRFARP
jgi:ribonucleotide monophosphatase NagD (HAD superfamily)